MEERDDIIIGRNAVSEALRAGRQIDYALIAKGDRTGALGAIIAKLRDKGIPVKDAAPVKLDGMCGGGNHQGIIAVAAAHEYCTVGDLFKIAEERREPLFVIIADEIEDPHNLGAIIRTAEATGVHGIIIPKRRSASLTFAVSKASAGASEHVAVARVSNLSAAIDGLKEKGVWIYGADTGGQMWDKTDFSGAVGLVIGSEGNGIGRLIREKCDAIVSLPMLGKVNSLNASVACGVVLYEIARQRIKS